MLADGEVAPMGPEEGEPIVDAESPGEAEPLGDGDAVGEGDASGVGVGVGFASGPGVGCAIGVGAGPGDFWTVITVGALVAVNFRLLSDWLICTCAR